MMKESWMEVLPLPPAPYFAGQAGGWFLHEQRDGGGGGGGGGAWSLEENKLFEEALARVDGDAPDRWARVVEMLPGKTVAPEQFGALVDSKPHPPALGRGGHHQHHFMPSLYGNLKLEASNGYHGGRLDDSVLMQMQCGQLQPFG